MLIIKEKDYIMDEATEAAILDDDIGLEYY